MDKKTRVSGLSNFFYFIKLLRSQQWYKNILILAVPIFSRQFFLLDYRIIIGFLLLCLVSSSNYIINDIVDRKKDAMNPEKKDRPIASGKIMVTDAMFLVLILLTTSLSVAWTLNPLFFGLLLVFFINTQLYTFFLKNHIYADILFIAINFVLRAFSGYFFLDAELSHWLIIATFFLAMLLASGKRNSEYHFLEEKKKHRKVFEQYTSESLDIVLNLSLICFIMSISIFPFFSQFAKNLVYLLPFSVYLCLRYWYLVKSVSKVPRHLELVYQDKPLFFVGIAYAILVFVLVYIIK
ncbi:UbiA family prenyltransferase [Candidatus Woesearchaeota archaeon]|nr:UbiA family prenyltransferase [Candidatus Woesearchaeota archaeon]